MMWLGPGSGGVIPPCGLSLFGFLMQEFPFELLGPSNHREAREEQHDATHEGDGADEEDGVHRTTRPRHAFFERPFLVLPEPWNPPAR